MASKAKGMMMSKPTHAPRKLVQLKSKPVSKGAAQAKLADAEAKLDSLTQMLQETVLNEDLMLSMISRPMLGQPEEEPDDEVVKCVKCGTIFYHDAKFCRGCGERRPVPIFDKRMRGNVIPQDFMVEISNAVDSMLQKEISEGLFKPMKPPEPKSPDAMPPHTDFETLARQAVEHLRSVGVSAPCWAQMAATPEPEEPEPKQTSDTEVSPVPGALAAAALLDTPGSEPEDERQEKDKLTMGRLLGYYGDDSPSRPAPDPSKTLLLGSKDSLLDDLKSAEARSMQTDDGAARRAALESQAEATDSPSERPSAPRFFLTDEKQAELEEALWRLRKYFRQRFGSSEKAWQALLESSRSISDAQDRKAIRLGRTLTIAELKIALSRLNVKLGHITGFDKARTLFLAVDSNETGQISFEELMGDDSDPSLRQLPPPPMRQPWESTLMHPKRWDGQISSGLFDKDTPAHIVNRDIFRPSKPQFKVRFPKRPDDYQPIWERFPRVMHEKQEKLETMWKAKQEDEVKGCTFRPKIENSLRTGRYVLRRRRGAVKRSRSQPSIRARRLQEWREERRQAESHSFRPQLCKQSHRIWELMRHHEGAWHDRLSKKEVHDRMGLLESAREATDEALTFWPELEAKDYHMHHERVGPVHERLFHHNYNEYWHVREGADWKEAHVFSMAKSRTDSDLDDYEDDETVAPSTPKEAEGRGRHVVEYRHGLLGLLEACERWGTKYNRSFEWALANPQFSKGKDSDEEAERPPKGGAASTAPAGGAASARRSPSPRDREPPSRSAAATAPTAAKRKPAAPKAKSGSTRSPPAPAAPKREVPPAAPAPSSSARIRPASSAKLTAWN